MAQKLPQKYGKYILLRKIAMGGMAEIFRAKALGAEGFEKTIVIKRILPHFTDDEAFVKMFIDEASIASKLQHSNIVQISDFDQEEDRYYIAMEYVEGADLKAVIERGIKVGTPLSPAQCANVMMEISKGLHYAHTKEYAGQALNIVHRDISPHNVMISYAGEAKLMDFGIAKAAQRSTKTMAGTVKGKCAYMSPEQARGKQLDGRSDLFALGIMLWEMLTHKRLFLGDSDFETLSNVLKAEAPPPSSVNPAVPKELDAIVLRALDKDRDKRQKNVEEFGRELTRWFYATITDHDAVALKPYLQRLFADDIDQLKAEYAEERRMQLEATGGADKSAASGPSPADRTVALAVNDDPQQAKTLMDGALNQQQLQEALAKQRAQQGGGVSPPAPDGATVALPAQQGWGPGSLPPGTGNFQQATGAFPQGHTGTFAGKAAGGPGALVIALAALVLLGIGGGAAWYFLSGQNNATANPTVAKGPAAGKGEKAEGKAVLLLKVDPYTAKVTADGEPVDGRVEGLTKGAKVRLVAEAPGYERLEEIVTITGLQSEASLKLVKIDRKMAIVIKPSDPTAIVWAGGVKLGEGAQTYQGTEGEMVEVELVRPEGGDPVKRTVKITDDQPVVEIEMPKVEAVAVATGAEVVVTVDPPDAEVTASAGTVVQRGSGWAVTGLTQGESVKISAKKGGFGSASEDVALSGATQSITLELRKRVVPTGPGKLKVNAKPWAKVTVDGKPHGTTPVTVASIKSGKHKVVLTKGSQSKSFNVTVLPGKTKSVFHDFAQ